jgi:hypothetical protein
VAALSKFEDFGSVSDDGDASVLDGTAVEEMLKKSVKTSTLDKYSRLWDKWACFASAHEVDLMSPDMRALEIFIVDTADLADCRGGKFGGRGRCSLHRVGGVFIPVHQSAVLQAAEGDQAHTREGGPSQEALYEGAHL